MLTRLVCLVLRSNKGRNIDYSKERRKNQVAKWTSPLLSDIRNQVAKSSVFSRWKGRNYFRSYVVPANPRTSDQKAVRANFGELVDLYQTIMATPLWKTAWNKRALEYLLSGFNTFIRFGQKSQIAISPTTGPADTEVTATYTCGIPLAEAVLYLHNETTDVWSDETPAGGIEAGEDKTALVVVSGATDDEIAFYLGTSAVLAVGDEAGTAYKYQGVTCWKPDKPNGVTVKALFTITA